jgi:hypothetical protein
MCNGLSRSGLDMRVKRGDLSPGVERAPGAGDDDGADRIMDRDRAAILGR